MTVLTRFALLLKNAQWHELRRRLRLELETLENDQPIADNIVQFLVLGEDRRHGFHPGFDVVGIGRATWRRLTSKRREGASTIAQQLVRVLTNRRERTLRRKFGEIALAIIVTHFYSPAQIARCYLKVGYYGWKMNGIGAAARHLGLRLQHLTDIEAASLVARLKYPEPQVAPEVRLRAIRRRTQHLLNLRHQSLGKSLRPPIGKLLHETI